MSQAEQKNRIKVAFGKLLSEMQQSESKIETKEEEAEKAKNQQLLERALSYTVDNIVNNMATLQLDFGNAIERLADKLFVESDKLDELKKAISVEQKNLQQLQKVRLVADALYILRQEHQEKLRIIEEKTSDRQEAIEKEMTQTRKVWVKEGEEFESKAREAEELLIKVREKEETDDRYELERQRQLETDEYEETKRHQEREIAETNRSKEKNWTEREQKLSFKQAEFIENQKKIAGFEDKLKEEYNKAKGEAIKDADRDAKVKSDLFEKEWEAAKRGYELKVESLQVTIQKQTEQIAELTTQLQAVTSQAQNLAMRAFSGAN
ncbi:MAG: hypothetical protein ACRC2R_01635 [Xenococcaceae cyanobacterium]